MNSLSGSRGGGPGDKIPSGYRAGQLQQFSPEQMGIYQQGLGLVGQDSYLSKLAKGDQSTFEQIEAPAQRQFNEQLANISNRFSGAGMGARKSSGFQNATTAAASNFSQDLMARRHSMQRDAISDMIQFINQLLGQRPQDRLLVPKEQKQNQWGQIAGRALGSGADIAATYAGGGFR